MYAMGVVGLRCRICRIRSDGKKEGEWIWWINRGRDRAGTIEMSHGMDIHELVSVSARLRCSGVNQHRETSAD